MATLGGTIVDANANPVSRVVRAYRRDTGDLLGETTSSGTTGVYSLTVAYTGEVQVVLLDNALGTVENDQILRTYPV